MEAIVVTSFRRIDVELESALHEASSVINVAPGFSIPRCAREPPVATRYTSLVEEGHDRRPDILKFPVSSVFTGLLRRAVAADPSPVVPVA
jgi:hypothetical protein